jgi:hypothetical protein
MWYVGDTKIVERNYGLVFALFFFTVLAFIIVVGRTYTRTALVRNLGIDDCLMIGAVVSDDLFPTEHDLFRPATLFIHAACKILHAPEQSDLANIVSSDRCRISRH